MVRAHKRSLWARERGEDISERARWASERLPKIVFEVFIMIKIYTTPSCPYCQLAKDFFQEKNLEFEEINVALDQEALKEMVYKSGQMGVPVIDIDGKIFPGFNRPEIEKFLGGK